MRVRKGVRGRCARKGTGSGRRQDNIPRLVLSRGIVHTANPLPEFRELLTRG